MKWEELLERERLRLLPPSQVYETLFSLKEVNNIFHENLPEPTIAVLLERNEPLVDLALARFCSDEDVTAKLFAKGGALRVAVLANRNWGRLRMPRLQEGTLAEVLREGPDEEAQAFLTNPSVAPDLLKDVAAGQGIGQGLPDERRMSLVRWLAENPALKTLLDEGDNIDDATTAWEAWAPIQAMWNLLWDVPPTRAWAMTLLSLERIAFSLDLRENFLPNLETEDGRKEWEATCLARHKAFEQAFIDMLAERWATPSQEDGKAPYDPFANLRQTVVAKMAEASHYDQEILDKLRDHPDQAIRLGYYSGFDVSSDTDLEPFWEREGKPFVEAMITPRSTRLPIGRFNARSIRWSLRQIAMVRTLFGDSGKLGRSTGTRKTRPSTAPSRLKRCRKKSGGG